MPNKLLSKLPGVHSLTAYEVVADIGEIRKRCSIVGDTADVAGDSDGTIGSEDALDSFYPVQPRYQPLNPIKEFELNDYLVGTSNNRKRICASTLKIDFQNSDISESLSFLREIRKSRDDLHATESHREEMELLSKAYSCALQKETAKFSDVKPEEETYLRLLQSLYIRNLRLNIAQSKQQSMLHHTFDAIKKKKESVEALELHYNNLQIAMKHLDERSPIATKSVIETRQQVLHEISQGVSRVLRIQGENSSHEVVIFMGQCIVTPFGEGKITSINTLDNKITIRLRYGILYSTPATILSWSEDIHFDGTSEQVLLRHWDRLKYEVSAPAADKDLVSNLFGSQKVVPAADTEEMDSYPTAGAVPIVALHTVDTEDNSREGSTSDMNNQPLSQLSENDRRGADPLAAAIKAPLCRTRASSSNSEHDKLIGQCFPLPVANSESSIRTVEKYLLSKMSEEDAIISSKTLAMAFSPPGSLAFLLQKKTQRKPYGTSTNQNAPMTSSSFLSCHSERLSESAVHFDMTALAESYGIASSLHPVSNGANHVNNSHSSDNGVSSDKDDDAEEAASMIDKYGIRMGCTGSVAWTGDIQAMRSSLRAMMERLQKLKNEQSEKLRKVEQCRATAAKLSEDTMALRLASFTRRITHRNNLSKHGIFISTPNNNAVPIVKMGLRGGGSNGNIDSSTKTVTPTSTTTVRSLAPLRNGNSQSSTMNAANSRIPRSGSKGNDLLSLVSAANGLAEGVDNCSQNNTMGTQNAKLNSFTFIKPVVVPTDEQSIGSSSIYSTQSGVPALAAVSTNRNVKSSKSSYKRPRSGGSSSRSRSAKSRKSAAAANKKRSSASSNGITEDALVGKEDEDDNEDDDEDDMQNNSNDGNHVVVEQDGSGIAASRSSYKVKVEVDDSLPATTSEEFLDSNDGENSGEIDFALPITTTNPMDNATNITAEVIRSTKSRPPSKKSRRY